ncbi:MAG: hypothetical protein AB1894_13680 [Chloroflexota bacterium]
MSKQSRFYPYLLRLLLVSAISLGIVITFNEIAYLIQKDENDRAPKTIQLTIPAGTAQSLESGVDVSIIPPEMVFVLGDVLEVKNEDIVTHQIGPIWVPPDATGSLVMGDAQKFTYACSFKASKYFDFDVRQPTTLGTRLTAISITAPTMGSLLFLYSLLVYPIKTKQNTRSPQAG